MYQLFTDVILMETGGKGKQCPPQKYTPGIISLSASDAKTYLGILWHGRGYRKSGITDFSKTVLKHF